MSKAFELTAGLVEAVSSALGIKPKNVIAQDTLRTQFYQEWCWKYIYAMFKIEMPEHWDRGYVLKSLFKDSGLIGVSDTELGVVPLRCSASGLNLYDHPTTLIFDNYILGSFSKIIDVDCVPLFFDENVLERHISPMCNVVNYFSQILAQCDGTISQNLMNTRIATIVECADKREAKTARAVMDEIYNGSPVVFTEVGMVGKVNILQAKNTYVSNEIQDLKRSIKNDFLSMFGYNNTNYTKKSRQTISEVESNNAEIIGGLTYWLETMQEQIKKVNAMFGLNLSISMRPWAEVQEMVGDTSE